MAILGVLDFLKTSVEVLCCRVTQKETGTCKNLSQILPDRTCFSKMLFLIPIIQRNEFLDDRSWALTGISSHTEASDSLKEIAHLSQQSASPIVFVFSANFISLLGFPGI